MSIRENDINVDPSILLALLNYLEEEYEKDLTQSIDEMRQAGIKDPESLENYLKKQNISDNFEDVDSLKELFGNLLLDNPAEDILPAPIDAVINYDGEDTMSIGLSVHVNVFDYIQADLTFKNIFAKLPKIKTACQVADILWEVAREARKILKNIAASDNFQISLWHEGDAAIDPERRERGGAGARPYIMTVIKKDAELNSLLEAVNGKKVVCPLCGGQFRLKEVSEWDIPDDGTYDWTKPIYSECNMFCTVCGYSPGFENDFGKVILDEDDVQGYKKFLSLPLVATNSELDPVKSHPMFRGILDEARTIAEVDDLELSEVELEQIAARTLCKDAFSETVTLFVRETLKEIFPGRAHSDN